MLANTVASLDGRAELEESAVLAVELLRLEDLNGDINMFPYNGAPMRGNGKYNTSYLSAATDNPLAKDQHANMLISRVAGLGTLQHKPIGFTGPLSQHLLGYGSIVNLVRQALRDIVEAACTNMILTGCCDRKTDLVGLFAQYDGPFCNLRAVLTHDQITIPSSQQLRTRHRCQIIPGRTHK